MLLFNSTTITDLKMIVQTSEESIFVNWGTFCAIYFAYCTCLVFVI